VEERAALVTGNTVVMKAASNTPGCAELLVMIYEDAGLAKASSISSTEAAVRSVMSFVNNPIIRAVSFYRLV